ncbi:tyrosine-type recombinase/integrase [Photobacterium indicum]|uniref:Integrase n=1 Tax=Photobacterium indicum TaxID=81447 RepID=A0A2T3L3B1_9GAMM|nr:integrase arm-type DNA-binding domain-containing protein [Photobacterium indicum]PSV43598.1 hypothetical protein C9J47_22280 [Photobacterium indicum]
MAEKIKLTQRNIKTLEVKSTRYRVLDTEVRGLFVEMMQSGSKVFRLRKFINKQNKTITIGEWGPLTISEAREIARAHLVEVARGIDPNVEKIRHRLATVTLDKVLSDYLKARDLKPTTSKGYESKVKRNLPEWLDRPLADLTEQRIAEAHASISKRTKADADYTARVLRALFEFARYEYRDENGGQLFPDNPVVILKHRRQWNNVGRKSTHIRRHDLAKFWVTVEQFRRDAISSGESIPAAIADSLLVVVLTGLRKSEVLGLEWSSINLDSDYFVIGETKNGDPLELPIPPKLKEILSGLWLRRRNGAKYVFQNPKTKKPISEPKKVTKKINDLAGIEFGYHDLRRTFATVAESLSLGKYQLKRLLNHRQTSDDVTEGYTILTAEELREPAERIESRVLELAGIEIDGEVMSNRLFKQFLNLPDEYKIEFKERIEREIN